MASQKVIERMDRNHDNNLDDCDEVDEDEKLKYEIFDAKQFKFGILGKKSFFGALKRICSVD